MSATLALRGATKRFDGQAKPVVSAVDLDIAAGEFMVFVGPSGSGKSTLLRMIAGLEEVSAGEIHIGGCRADTLPAARRGIAMVFQSYALYPHMDVHDNLGFALRMAGLPRREVAERVRRTAEVLQIESLLQRRPRELSGGQRQRVAIGRAIVREPQVFLFDEPLSNLDAALRQDMRIELSRLHRRLGATMVYVTHDQVEAMTLADRIAVFDGGVVQQVGTPAQLYQQPANLFVAGFLGSPRMNLLRSGDHTVGIRPEHLALVDAAGDDTRPATVEAVEYLGDHVLAYLRVAGADAPLCAKLGPGAELPEPGRETHIRIPLEHRLLFDAGGRRL